MKAFLVFLLKLALTALCLWWAFSNVEFDHSVFTRPGAVDYRWLAAGAGLAGLSVVLNGLRWWFFLRGQSLDVSLGRAVELTMIDGLFSLASVSGLGGDAARIILLMRDHPERKLIIAMAVTADHLAGLVSIALLFFIISAARFDALADPSVLGRGVIHFAWFYMGGGLAMVAFIFICASPPVHRRIHGNDRFARWPLMKRIPELYDVYRKNWRHALAGVAVSFLMLGAYFSSYYCGMRAVGGTSSYRDAGDRCHHRPAHLHRRSGRARETLPGPAARSSRCGSGDGGGRLARGLRLQRALGAARRFVFPEKTRPHRCHRARIRPLGMRR
jgi:uncharacterized membrane protein YbhN (UPF0104 family)